MMSVPLGKNEVKCREKERGLWLFRENVMYSTKIYMYMYIYTHIFLGVSKNIQFTCYSLEMA